MAAPSDDRRKADDFASQADQASVSLIREFIGFLGHHKKWWLLPILLVLALITALVMMSGTAFAPFIYTFF